MYWFRTDTPFIFLVWLAVAIFWGMGGWLLASHAFRLERHERLLVGFSLGVTCYLWLINLIGRWLQPTLTFSLAGLLVLLLGVSYAWKGEGPVLDWKDLEIGWWLLIGLVLLWVFARTARGLAIFDDRKNISIVSTMAAGDIPPHHYMNAGVYFAYHYGFQLLGASMMRLGGLFAWSAYDLSKAIIGADALLLAGLLGKRYIDKSRAGLVIAGVLAFSTGTRYLLLLAPAGLMARIDPLINVRAVDQVVGMPLSLAIRQGIIIGDGPPAPFLYAFMSGIGWPVVMAIQAGPSTMSLVLLLLTWLLAPRIKRPAALFILVIMFSLWAIVWESSYGVFLAAGVITGLYWLWQRSDGTENMYRWVAMALLISAPIALFQGGTITEIVRKIMFNSGTLTSSLTQGLNVGGGFSLRWPPAIYSSHLGALSVNSPLEVLVGILELGPVVLFTPWITWWAWKRLRQGDWILGTMVLSAWLGFALPIFFSYEYDRDIVRFTKHGLLIWTLVLAIILLDKSTKWIKALRYPAMAGLALMIAGGLAIASTELTAASQEVLTEDGIIGLDSRIAQDVWDQLQIGSEIFDPQTWRGTMLTGRLTRVVTGNMSYDYDHSAAWEKLRENPSVEAMLANGFRYVYVDEAWWGEIPPESRISLSESCVRIVSEHDDANRNQFRRLIDLAACQP